MSSGRYNEKLRAADAAAQRILQRCATDPLYYILDSGFVRTKDEHDQDNSRKPFPKKEYLRWVLNEWHNSGQQFIVTGKSRQLMVSWLLAAYGMWTAQFRPDSLVLWQSKKEEDAAPFIYEKTIQHARMSTMLANLPEWLRVCRTADGSYIPIDLSGPGVCSYACLSLPNGSQVLGLAQGASQVEGKVPTLFISDESSLQAEWDTAMAAVKPAIEKASKILAVGTMRLPSAFGEAIAPWWDQRGLNFDDLPKGCYRFNAATGAYGIFVHYSADPDKDPATPVGAAWKRGNLETGSYPGGEKGWQWQQHMEGNPLSRAGTVCIPAFRDIEPYIKIANLSPGQTFGWSFDSGLDYGVRNNSVLLCFGMRPDGRRFLLWEYSKPGAETNGIPGFSRKIMECPWFRKINGDIQSDPSLWNTDQNLPEGLVTRAQIFEDNGVFLVPAKSKGQPADEVALDRLNHYYWAHPYPLETFQPLLYICENAVQTLKNFPNLMFQEWSETAAENNSLKETMRNKDVDEWDAFKYAEAKWKDVPKYVPTTEPGTMGWYKKQWKRLEPAKKSKGDLY